MNGNNSPFTKSTVTARSPDKTKPGRRTPTEIPNYRTRSQSVTNQPTTSTTLTLPNKPIEYQITSQTTDTENRTGETQPTLDKTTTSTQTIQTRQIQNTKMSQKEIQQTIATFIPEFSGEESPYRTDNLMRFTGAADSQYEELSEAEKKIFDKLIKFRLTGDAYMRISRREVTDYPTLKRTLNSMYSTTQSLEELERNFMQTQQRFGETVRNFGNRLTEAMSQYKTGYKIKYGTGQIDQIYKNHLEATLVQVFKRGLNNTILKEKIATFRAKNIDEIMDETETIQKMLELTTTTHLNIQPPNENTHTTNKHSFRQPQTQTNRNQMPTVICNYCNKPNHTWDICRTRIAQENFQQQKINFPQKTRHQFNRTTQPQPYHFPPRQPANQQNQINHYPPNNNFTSHTQNYPQNNPNFTQYRQPQPRNSYAPKYCSFCKTTTGHTFEECKSKFYRKPIQYSTQAPENYQPIQQPNKSSLEDTFKNMQIKTVYPQENYYTIDTEYQDDNQGNSNGSDRS